MECTIPSVNPGTATQTLFLDSTVAAMKMPSYDSLAKAEVDRMLKDSDIQDLPADVMESTRRFSAALVRSFPFSGSSRIAVFGDVDESVGEIVFLDRQSTRQVELTVKAGSADVWMRGPTEKLMFEAITVEQLPLLSAVFSRLR